jgi:hypothetical protein
MASGFLLLKVSGGIFNYDFGFQKFSGGFSERIYPVTPSGFDGW